MRKSLTLAGIFILLFWLGSPDYATAQDDTNLAGQVNTITTAVPFLMIAPDSRSGAMGDAGVALSPDVNSLHWNPSKYAFIDDNFGTSISYTPWLRNIIDDINLSYLTGYWRLDDKQVFAASLRYFSLGNIQFFNNQGTYTRDFNPNEFALSGSYSRKLGDKISGGVALRYIYSNLTGGAFVGNTESHPGHSVAADISTYYESNRFPFSNNEAKVAFGLNVSNIGAKITYTNEAEENFIPTNMRLGGAFTTYFDNYNSLTLTLDLNKLLIPTPPEYQQDTADNTIISAGYDPDVSVATGIFRSFYDAPGGMEEELHEITYSAGLEYWYADQFALRAGYFHEHETKGNRKYFTAGLGLELNVIGLDFSYLIATDQHNPLENTLRFSIYLDFSQAREQEQE